MIFPLCLLARALVALLLLTTAAGEDFYWRSPPVWMALHWFDAADGCLFTGPSCMTPAVRLCSTMVFISYPKARRALLAGIHQLILKAPTKLIFVAFVFFAPFELRLVVLTQRTVPKACGRFRKANRRC